MTDRELEIMSSTRKSAPRKMRGMGMDFASTLMELVLDGTMLEMGYAFDESRGSYIPKEEFDRRG